MITLKDVAETIGCDVSTVSRVLNGKPNRVSEANRNRIHEVARQLGYIANRTASSLASGSTHTVGVLVSNVFDGVYAEYIEKLDLAFSEAGYSLRPFICHNRPDKEALALDALLHHEVDAMISMHYSRECEDVYARIKQHSGKLIFRSVARIPEISFDHVLIDLEEGYRELSLHLARQGCRRIAVVGGSVASLLALGGKSDSVQFFKEGIRAGGLAEDSSGGIVCADEQESAYQAVKKLYGKQKSPPFDGLIVQSINKVVGVCRALQNCGFAIPSDVKVATFSDLPLCRLFPVPLTVWAQPVDDICTALVESTLKLLKSPEMPPSMFKFKSSLIVRESSGKDIMEKKR